MSFTNQTKEEAFTRSGGQCECRKLCPHHTLYVDLVDGERTPVEGRCQNMLRNGWDVRHITAVALGGDDSLLNCVVLCPQCYRADL